MSRKNQKKALSSSNSEEPLEEYIIPSYLLENLSEKPLQEYIIDGVIPSLLENCTGEMSVFLNEHSKWLPQQMIWNLIKKKYDFKKNELGLRKKYWSDILFVENTIEKDCVDEMQRVIDDEDFFLDVLMITFKERASRPKGLREFIKQKMIEENAFRKRMLMLQPKEFTGECKHIVSDLLVLNQKKSVLEDMKEYGEDSVNCAECCDICSGAPEFLL